MERQAAPARNEIAREFTWNSVNASASLESWVVELKD
jgi:hypothetical protein